MSTPDRGRPRVVLAPEVAEIAESVIARLPGLVDRVVGRIEAEIEFLPRPERGEPGGSPRVGPRQSRVDGPPAHRDEPPDLSAPRAAGSG
jgi:hypothetical protein